jgi:ubiquinone/menaquinone biosynthesis C-methylase UbiE
MPRIGRRRRKETAAEAEPGLPVQGAADRHIPPGLEWFWEKYHDAAGQIVSFCESCSVSLTGTAIADIGCGEGSMALGLYRRVDPARLVAFDIKTTDVSELLQHSSAVGESVELPAGLEFLRSEPTSIPAGDEEFDFVYSWSAFEHIADPIAVLREVDRILRPNGYFFLQLWPFYFSAKGSHLWQWFDEDFHHLLADERDVVAQVLADDRQPPDWTQYMTREFEHLNRLTVNELQRCVLAAGFDVIRIELISWPTTLTPALARYPWTDLAISGIKLLARAPKAPKAR